MHLPFESRATLRFQHRSEVAVAEADEKGEDQGENGIETVGDGSEEHSVGVFRRADEPKSLVDQADLVADPRRDDDGARDGRGAGVDEKRELLARDEQPVGDGAHQVAAHEDVGVVVEEDDDRHDHGGDLPAFGGPGVPRDELGDAAGTAVLGNDADHPAEEEAEHEDLCLARRRDRVDDEVGENGEEACDEDCSR